MHTIHLQVVDDVFVASQEDVEIIVVTITVFLHAGNNSVEVGGQSAPDGRGDGGLIVIVAFVVELEVLSVAHDELKYVARFV